MKRINPRTAPAEAIRAQERLDHLGLGWLDLGTALNATNQNLYYWRTSGIPKPYLEAAAAFLNCSIGWLITGEAERMTTNAERAALANLLHASELSNIDYNALKAMAESLMTCQPETAKPQRSLH